MQKMKLHTPNLADENFARLAALFPNAVTETTDADGKVIRAIDKDVLMQEINCYVVDGKEERYQFTWPDKKKSVLLANAPSTNTLRPCVEESVGRGGETGGFDSENLYIEGDNLEVLKLLKETYLHKIKMIYIDPPYNTGNDFVYDDDFTADSEEYKSVSGDFDAQGNRLVKNLDSNGRFHTDWLNMIYPRLRLAKDLLTDDGVIFISIDDNEVENLKKVCDEVFGEKNNQALVTYVRKTSGKQDSTNFMKSTEYLLVYSRSDAWDCTPLVASDNVTDRYNKIDNEGKKFRETDLRKTGTGDRREDRPLMWYPFYYNPKTNDLLVREKVDEKLKTDGYIEIFPIKPDDTDGRWRWGFTTAESNINNLVARIMPKYKEKNKYTIYEIDYIDKKGDIRTVKEHTFWDRTEFNSDNAMADFKKMGFSNQLFPFPKSKDFIKHCIYLGTDNASLNSNFPSQTPIILDFFSGSATTAHAVMQLNAEDGGNRKFIMVQLPEKCDESSEAFKAGYKNICEIGKERIRRAGKQIVESEKLKVERKGEKNGKQLSRLDGLAKGDGFSGGDLFSSEEIAERGNVRTVRSDAAGGGIDSVEHSGRASSQLNEGIHTVSSDSERFNSRTGNATSSMCENKLPSGIRDSKINESNFRSSENDFIINTKVESEKLKVEGAGHLSTKNFQLSTDIGFRVLKLDTSNMQEVYYTPQATDQQMLSGMVDNIKPDRTDMDLLFQVMLEYGISLSSKIECKKIDDKDVYFVEDTFLAACFDKSVNDAVVTEIAKAKPQYVALRDMDSDATLTNLEQIFNTISPETVCKVI